jgi:hypothetical protein
MIWHDGRDWGIKRHGVAYWHRSVENGEWTAGLPPGLSEDDMALLFRSLHSQHSSLA